ncbi:MAG: DUF4252 domain-containing protein [Bacteroidales bacterium]|nr:DUF4252 domain-containing protein [Bacteroidales bacterium]MCD8393276.1 DUF4252 domain-containing protein [Bacteroidales bacterium]
MIRKLLIPLSMCLAFCSCSVQRTFPDLKGQNVTRVALPRMLMALANMGDDDGDEGGIDGVSSMEIMEVARPWEQIDSMIYSRMEAIGAEQYIEVIGSSSVVDIWGIAHKKQGYVKKMIILARDPKDNAIVVLNGKIPVSEVADRNAHKKIISRD